MAAGTLKGAFKERLCMIPTHLVKKLVEAKRELVNAREMAEQYAQDGSSEMTSRKRFEAQLHLETLLDVVGEIESTPAKTFDAESGADNVDGDPNVAALAYIVERWSRKFYGATTDFERERAFTEMQKAHYRLVCMRIHNQSQSAGR